jgi:hypothetical protein
MCNKPGDYFLHGIANLLGEKKEKPQRQQVSKVKKMLL